MVKYIVCLLLCFVVLGPVFGYADTQCVKKPSEVIVVMTRSCYQKITPDMDLRLSFHLHPYSAKPCGVDENKPIIETHESGFLASGMIILIAAGHIAMEHFGIDSIGIPGLGDAIVKENEDAIVLTLGVEIMSE